MRVFDLTESASEQKSYGAVRFYDDSKGYGFAIDDGGGPDLYIGRSDLRLAGIDSVHPGTRLAFDVEVYRDGRRRARAIELLP